MESFILTMMMATYCTVWPFLVVLALSSSLCSSFTSTRIAQTNHQRCRHDEILSRLDMISFGAGGSSSVSFPRDVKEAISKCRAAVQEALGSRLSRMDVEFPVGTKFGVEKQKGRKKAAAAADGDDGAPTRELLDSSDRELARLFVEMFQPVGGENIATVFMDETRADQARKSWKGDPSASCRILSMGRRRGRRSGTQGMGGAKKQKRKPMGFAAKMAVEVDGSEGGAFELPDCIEVALFVAPGPKELIVVDEICSTVGMGTLVVLLNARLSKISNFGSDAAARLYREEFEPVFHLGAAPQNVAPGLLLYRQYPGDWMVARKLGVGKPKLLAKQTQRPTADACRNIYESIELSDIEKGVEGIVENVAGWFN